MIMDHWCLNDMTFGITTIQSEKLSGGDDTISDCTDAILLNPLRKSGALGMARVRYS